MEREKGVVVGDVHTVSGMTPPSSFRLHRSRMREASEITSRDASEQILALIRVGYTVLTYPRVFPARFYLPYLIRDYHCRRYFNPRPPSLTWISTPLLSAPCIFGSAEIRRFRRSKSTFARRRDLLHRPFDRS